ncbi:uncharacterized protein C18orf19 homolog A-like [Teleopsis dalmanni]|uniref:uncharacterized protein C18orf19 homolog A-like n=1 Tax=Teleopsis dalmanni TaxID=139649 RepID=UPI0018CFAFEB|nr:uncharacterized protein C18orf19 homolog A-like [Teleopsis dalmanni]
MYRYMRKKPCPDFNEKVNAIETDVLGGSSSMGLFARYKRTYKKYWFVVIPVHIVTSIGWLSIFYLLSKSGVDIAALLQSLNFSEPVINKARDSKMGHAAIAFLCYELATPLRYVVTLGATTFSIKYFTKIGRIKSVPSHREIVRMFKQQKAERSVTKKNKNGKFGEKP